MLPNKITWLEWLHLQPEIVRESYTAGCLCLSCEELRKEYQKYLECDKPIFLQKINYEIL